MEIGQPRKTIVITPLELPVPRKTEDAPPREPAVVAPPEREKVPA